MDLSRRDLIAMAAAAAAGPRFSGACDCHVHIFGDPGKFPMSPARTYSPGTALVPELRDLHRTLGISRVVIVQPSVYGTDNSCTLDGIKHFGANARGVAVIDEETAPGELDRMSKAGIRGIRVNLGTAGVSDPEVGRRRVEAAIKMIGKRGWHIQVYAQLPMIEAIYPLVRDAPMPFVFDHFGGAQAAKGLSQPGWESLLKLVGTGRAYVKISAPYRVTSETPGPNAAYDDVAPFARALIAANPDRILWGSDWPHPDTRSVPGHKATDPTPRYPVNDVRIFALLPVWAPDEDVRKKILVGNPARLYRFS